MYSEVSVEPCTTQYPLIISLHFVIDANAIILASLPPVNGRTMEVANLIVELASSGTKHVLKFARAAEVTKVIYTGSFSNVLHPDNSWNPIVVTENGKLTK